MSLVLYQHPFAMYRWKALIALCERDVPFTANLVEADRSALAALCPPAWTTSSTAYRPPANPEDRNP